MIKYIYGTHHLQVLPIIANMLSVYTQVVGTQVNNTGGIIIGAFNGTTEQLESIINQIELRIR